MTFEQLKSAHAHAALLAAIRGQDNPHFLAIFERLETMIEKETQKESTLDRARRLAGLAA